MRRLLFTLCCCGVISCSSSQQSVSIIPSQRVDTTATFKPHPPRVSIAPGHCRIVGAIVDIDSTLNNSDTTSPCSKAPCKATVRIDSVLGYGSAFPGALAKGSTIPVRFGLTLNPTNALFPDMTKRYPRLSVGSRFIADVEGREGIASTGGNPVLYSIEGYEIIPSLQQK